MNWRQIDTAPKDGTYVLAYFPEFGGFQQVVAWNSPNPTYLPHWNNGRLLIQDPLWWMPLPEPPK